MSEFDMLIQDLNSSDLEQRYLACKRLKERASLPPNAIQALQEASTDPEPLVSATALLALLSHESLTVDPGFMDNTIADIQPPYTSREIITGLALSFVIVLLTIPLFNIINDDHLNDLWFLSLPTILIAGYISYLSYQDNNLRPILVVLSSIVVGLLSAIIIFLLFSGLFLMAVSAYFG